jgi:cyclomaltodextrinase / maltogenic alpha-amylase / neopullulanase
VSAALDSGTVPPVTTAAPDWVRDAVFYQIFPDRFGASERVPKPGSLEAWDAPPTTHGFKGGDLLGIVERLPYLEGLGVNALYLTPVFSSASNHRYHTYDYFSVDPLLGGDDALRELLDRAHERGMRVILDGVFNHTGRGFWPFHHLLEAGGASPYRNWFHLDEAVLAGDRPLDAYPAARPSGATGDGNVSRRTLGYQAWWDLPALPKLNTDSPAVRDYIYGVAEHWIRFGIDGWRLDVPEEIPDEAFWQEFRRRVLAVNPEAYLVGEIWKVAPDWLRGDRFDGLMNYPLAEAILSFAGGRQLDADLLGQHHEYGPRVRVLDGPGFAARLDELLAAYGPETFGVQLNLLDSHDTPRFHSLVSGDRAAYRMAVTLQATLPGAPCIYYGDEIGLAGGLDPDSRRAFPTDPGDWDRELLAYVSAVMQLRRAEPALRRGGLRVVGATGDAIVYERVGTHERLVCGFNAGESEAVLRVADVGHGATPVDLPGTAALPWHGPELRLPARTAVVYRLSG